MLGQRLELSERAVLLVDAVRALVGALVLEYAIGEQEDDDERGRRDRYDVNGAQYEAVVLSVRPVDQLVVAFATTSLVVAVLLDQVTELTVVAIGATAVDRTVVVALLFVGHRLAARVVLFATLACMRALLPI